MALDDFPIGYLLISAKADYNPNGLLTGTWEKQEGFFIYASDATHPVGTTGGSNTHTLTTAEMPSHTHTIAPHTHNSPAHRHAFLYYATQTADFKVNWGEEEVVVKAEKTTQGGETDEVAVTIDNATVTVQNTGSGTAFDCTPKYKSFNCWVRTA